MRTSGSLTAASCFPLTFPALSVLVGPIGKVGLCVRGVWDTVPLVSGHVFETLPSS